jgi:CRP-like cAMP-binding protein
MQTTTSEPTYRIWGADNVMSSLANLPTLTDWAKARRVTANTWVFNELRQAWIQAGAMPELNLIFGSHQHARNTVMLRAREMGVTPEVLRRIKILSQMDDNQLERFVEFIELQPVDVAGYVVRKGQHGDAMYFVLEGELRARLIVDGKESLLATLNPGDFFGETSLLDQGPRSADVVASYESLLLKITAASFDRMRKEAPDVALEFLFNVSRSVVIRMRSLNKRHEDSLHMWQALPQ